MRTLKILSAASLFMVMASPVFALAAIQEPGAFAFYHPAADVLNSRSSSPSSASNEAAFASAHASVASPRVRAGGHRRP